MPKHWLGLAAILFVTMGIIAGCAPSETPAEPEAPSQPETPAPVDTADAPQPEAAADPAPIREDQLFEVGDSSLLEGVAPEGWQLSTPVEHYKVDTLYNKIDGRSEMYMSYNVRELSWADYVHPEKPGRFIDIFVYDMQTASGAFGVYAAERELGQEKVELGRAGYATDANFYFWKGKYYAYVQSSHDDEEGKQAAWHVAQALNARLTDGGETVRGLDWLPTEGLNEDSITYFLVDAMSLDFMTDTFTARYDLGLAEQPICFVSQRESAEAAAALFEEYRGYLTDYGMSTEELTEGSVTILLGDLGGGYYDGGFVVGETLAGISAVKGHEEAIAAAKAFAALMQKTP